MAARTVASATALLFTACAAGFLLVAPFPHSAGSRVALLLAALALLVWNLRNDPRAAGLALLPRSFAWAAIAWCAWCIASVAWSVDSAYTKSELRREILYDAMAFIVFFAGTRTFAQVHAWSVVIIASTLLLGLAEWLHLGFPDVWLLRRAGVGPGPLATQVVMAAPLLVLLVWPPPGGLGRGIPVAVAAAVALVAAGLAGESRIMWVALGAAIAVAFVVFRADVPEDRAARAAVRKALVVALAALAVLMIAAAEYKMRYYKKAESSVETLAYDQRPLIWEAAWRKFSERPWAGHGYGRDIIAADIRAATPKAGFDLNHAHNVFFDVAVQLGAIGLAIFAALVGTLAMAIARLRERAGGTALVIAGLALIAGYLTKNLTDDFFFRPHALEFWAITGMLLGAGLRAPPVR